jgi:hypothetical protein
MTQAEAAKLYAETLNGFDGIDAKVWFGGKVCRIYVRGKGKDCGFLELYNSGEVRKNNLHYTILNLAVPNMSPLSTEISDAITRVHRRAHGADV